MHVGLVGLGKMGAGIARRLAARGHQVTGYDRDPASLAGTTGIAGVESPAALVAALTAPRTIWLMLPAGPTTEAMLATLAPLLAAGDTLIDGGNARYTDSVRRAAALRLQGIEYIDAGTSGGIHGEAAGYCLMLGGEADVIARHSQLFADLAVAGGWGHVGPAGAGHYTKMIHNSIEYGAMQAYAEGFALLAAKTEFGLDLAAIAELWRHGSVVRSWLLELLAETLSRPQTIDRIAPVVADSGEGRWAAQEAIDLGVSAPVTLLALMARFKSQDPEGFSERLLAALRQAFGGHRIEPDKP